MAGVLLGLVGIAAGAYGLHIMRTVPLVWPERSAFEDDNAFKTAQLRSFYRMMTPWLTIAALVIGVPLFVVSVAGMAT